MLRLELPLFGNGKDMPQTGYCGETTVMMILLKFILIFLLKLLKESR